MKENSSLPTGCELNTYDDIFKVSRVLRKGEVK